MRDVLVFNGASHLDFQDIRTNVVRIPEVVNRIREAQNIWDTISNIPLDLANFIGSEDEVFLGHIRLKSFASAVVQVGLLDRYLKTNPLPGFMVGIINGDSPMTVAMSQKSFFDLVSESPSTGNPLVAATGESVTSTTDLPILSGVQIAEYAIFRRNPQGVYERLGSDTRDVEKMLIDLADQYDVQKFIMVGPGNSVGGRKLMDLTSRDIQILETIDMDPMLSWFWSALKQNRLAIAN